MYENIAQKNMVKRLLRHVGSETILSGSKLVRRIISPQKYKTIDFICDYLGSEVEMNDSAKVIRNKVITHLCTSHSQYFPKDCACLIYSNPVYNIDNLDWKADSAIQKGAAVLITSKSYKDYPCIISKNPLETWAKLCRYYRDLQKRVRITAVIGSIGKTTTKNMVGEVYRTAYRTTWDRRNLNTLTSSGFAAQHIPHWAQMMVQEVHEGEINETQYISQVLHPDVAIITAIDRSHYQFFGSEEKIIAEVCSIVRHMPPQGIVVVNMDEFTHFDLLEGRKAVTVSANNAKADFFADKIMVDECGLHFTVVVGATNGRYEVLLNNIYAPHNAVNALYAFAAGYCEGIEPMKIVKGLSNFRTRGVRQNVMTTKDGVLVYADCYNAVPRSMKSAMDACDLIPVKGKRIAVLGDVEEGGELSDKMHQEILGYVNDSLFDNLLYIGDKMGKAVASCEGIKETLSVNGCKSIDDLADAVKGLVQRDDLILFKASHASHLESCIKKVWPYLSKKLSETSGNWVKTVLPY